MRQRLTRRDAAFIAVCIAVAAISVAVIVRFFDVAFPQASIEFKVDRGSSRVIAERFLRQQGIDVSKQKHAVRFDSDDSARIFLERSLGLEKANRVLRDQVRVWSWHHRWFTPLVEEEYSVDVAPTGEVIGFSHKIPEDRPLATTAANLAPFVSGDLTLVDTSERRLPHRVQHIYTYESKTIRPAGAPYRTTITVDGDRVTGFSKRVKVPEAWLRAYREMRSKNFTAGSIDVVLMIATIIAAVAVFIIRLRRGDLPLRFLLFIGIASIVLAAGVALNSLPGDLANYSTTDSYPAFVGAHIFQAAMGSLGTAILLVVLCGAGEVLYRERFPQHLAMARLGTVRALASKRVFLSMILGYALVPMFIAYQVIFYLVANRFGAWSPAEVPYDELLNTALPWVAVLFAGFFPALSEEFLSRAFSIPLFERLFRSRWIAVVAAAFLWGFGHATYPNQPFWIRGVEVGMAGIVAGIILIRFGLLPLLIWHYTIDAVYTATRLFASGNTYYVVSAALASLIFAIPLIVSIVRYVRKGFDEDDALSNATMPVAPPPAHPEAAIAAAEFPAPIRATRTRVLVCIALVAAAIVAIVFRPVTPNDAIDYRITKEQAKEIAKTRVHQLFAYVIATPVEGFRSWDRDSPREDGGAPSDFDSIAATYLMHSGMSARDLVRVFRTSIEGGTWMVRFFTPLKKEEIFVEIDPRTSRVIGFHKYQDERNPGPSLAQADALAIARRAFAAYGVDVNRFQLEDALTFQQPRRRDWLFHFEERAPLVARAFRRVTVRVAGAEVTQFNKHVKVPESVYREASTQTLLNVALFVLQVIGVIALLALVVTGLVIATRTHGLPWRRALRWTLMLAVLPLAGLVAQHEEMLFGYSTSVAWETFRISLATAYIRNFAMQLGMLFLALAGLEAAVPYATTLLTREGRARFGRSAVIAAVTAIAVAALAVMALQWIETLVPRATSAGFGAPIEVAIPLPGLVEGARAVFGAIVACGAIALFATGVRKHAAALTIAAVFLAALDAGSTPAQLPLMLARAAMLAVLTWIIARWILDANPLAWPLAIFLGTALNTIATLASNHRPDLLANAIGLGAVLFVTILWFWRRDAGVV